MQGFKSHYKIVLLGEGIKKLRNH